jgi:low affinity Fe/Cu permease
VRRLTRLLGRVTDGFGHPAAFLGAIVVLALWAATYPLWSDLDTWQLVINTGTTCVTFVGVFAIQNEQNRDAAALHAKLDELLRAVGGDESLSGLEDEPAADVKAERDRRR